jgi:hypothetical protein
MEHLRKDEQTEQMK